MGMGGFRRVVAVVARVGAASLVLVLVAGCSGAKGGGSGAASASRARTTASHRRPVPAPDPDPRHLVLGDCFTADHVTLRGGIGATGAVHVVACDRPHDAEVFGRFIVAGPDYPPAPTWGPTADVDCGNLAPQYDMDSWTLAPSVAPVRSFLPTRDQWAAGDHSGVCYWVPAPGPTAGRLRHDKTTLTPDQYAYLDAAQRPESALAETPQRWGETSPDSYREWAGGVADSLTTEAQLLENHHWPVPAQGPAGALLQRLATLTPLWRDASRTVSPAGLKSALRSAEAQTTTSQERAVRAALGLTTARVG